MAEVLTPIQLKGLKEHKYSAICNTLLDPWMQPFWRWLVEQFPLTWAPNAITLTGLLFNILTTMIMVYYSPDAKQDIPGWVLFLAAAGLFLYQTLDAVDGKQARRTNSSTPLGELFDHGCDAFSIVFIMIGTSLALQLGTDPWWMFLVSFCAMFLFYASHWQTYASGTMRFSKVDVTEGQLIIIGVYLLSAILGNSMWGKVIPVLGFEMKYIILYFSLFSAVISSKLYFLDMFTKGGSGKGGSTVAGTSVLSPLPPIAIIVLLAIVIAQKSNTGLYENHPCLYIISFGMVISKVTNKLVISHMTRSPVEYLDSGYIGPGMLFLNQYFNTIINEYFVLCMCCLYCTADALRYSIVVCQQICQYLDIYCFHIKVPAHLVTTTATTTAHGNDSAEEEEEPIQHAEEVNAAHLSSRQRVSTRSNKQ